MEMSGGWQELGVVDTIYEDDHEEDDDDRDEEQEEERFDSPTMSSSAATSRSFSAEVEDAAAAAAAAHPSLPPALRRAVQAWYVRATMRVDQCDSISGENDLTD
jgi:3-oxoacyl-ACP reductase-like protein